MSELKRLQNELLEIKGATQQKQTIYEIDFALVHVEDGRMVPSGETRTKEQNAFVLLKALAYDTPQGKRARVLPRDNEELKRQGYAEEPLVPQVWRNVAGFRRLFGNTVTQPTETLAAEGPKKPGRKPNTQPTE
jgi:hypothetical protein